jgi:hypothetical protein
VWIAIAGGNRAAWAKVTSSAGVADKTAAELRCGSGIGAWLGNGSKQCLDQSQIPQIPVAGVQLPYY